jgi:hypothetical protein
MAAEQQSEDKTTIKEVQQELQDAAEAIKDYSVDQRDEAVAKMRAALEDLDARIDRIETQVEAKKDYLTREAMQKWKATRKALRKQRTEVAEWLGGLRHSSNEAWEDVKKGFSDAYRDLYDAFEKAEAEFESEKTSKGSN